jgi:hypothetical protein
MYLTSLGERMVKIIYRKKSCKWKLWQTYLQVHDSNGCLLHTTSFVYNCEERGWWSCCLFCPTAKHRGKRLEISSVFKMGVRQPFCKDISNNMKQLQGTTTVLQTNFIHIYVLKYIFLLSKIVLIPYNCIRNKKFFNESNICP